MLNMNGKDMFVPEDAVAYRIHFTAMICSYGSVSWDEIEKYDFPIFQNLWKFPP